MTTYLYVLNTLADWEIGYITAELNSGRYLDNTRPPAQIIKIGNTTEPIKTMGEMVITPDAILSDITFEDGDLLILPGAETWADESHTKILDMVPDLISKNIVVAAICGATIALANKGLLDNRAHTSNAKEVLKMFCPNYTGEKLYIDKPAVTDGNLITASGLAPLEFAYEIFKKTAVMKPKTLEAWYQLYATKEAKHFFALMESLGGE